MKAQMAISLVRRGRVLSNAIKAMLLLGAGAALFVAPALGMGNDGSILLIVVGAVWVFLSFRSIRSSQLTAVSPALIAAGEFDQAERSIDQSLNSFSLFQTARVMSLHHLAFLRHKQGQFDEAVVLCRELMKTHRNGPVNLVRQNQLILADALLEMNDVSGAYGTISSLYQHRLSLIEALNLLQLELNYLARVGNWSQMVQNIASKVQLAELLLPPAAAETQALLAMGATRCGLGEWAGFLKRRVELLCDVPTLIAKRPQLQPLWPDVATTDSLPPNTTG